MKGQSLAQKLDALAEFGQLQRSIPEQVTENLSAAIVLRPYQIEALQRFLFYADWTQRQRPTHLLFHMATGSGKTVLMAAVILDLYERGYRNFLFFVNSTQIIEKTKANFLDAASSKFLFAEPIRFDGKPVPVRAVSNFDEADADAINVHFTTIQGLHSALYNAKENAPTLEDFAGRRIVMLADEGHHLNALTKGNRATLDDQEDARDWETTVQRIFRSDPDNVLLEFTATAGVHIAEVASKYHDKILFDYSLRQFRADGYSKDIELRRADIPVEERMLQSVVLSQYRRKLAAEHGLALKPVILMKSRRIADSEANEQAFHALIEGLDAGRLEALAEVLPAGDTVGDALRHILRVDGGLSATDFAREIRLDFAQSKVRNVNKPEDLQRQQIELNSLEDRDNEIRVIFAVDKLNEGWDVLNLFDIVRLYNQGTNTTTNQEAQLIGRGARYWPFTAPDQPEASREQRKYDADEAHPLRGIEQLHYHCSHDPVYLRDIRKALAEAGLIDRDERKVTVRVKEEFRQSEFFKSGAVFKNERRTNARGAIFALAAYQVPQLIQLAIGHSRRTSEVGAFEEGSGGDAGGQGVAVRTLRFPDLGLNVLRHALDSNPFFRFDRLKRHLPRMSGMVEFMTGAEFLGGLKLEVKGPKATLDTLGQREMLMLARGALTEVEVRIAANSHDYVGTREFQPHALTKTVDDVTLTVGGSYRTRWADWPESGGIDLAAQSWFAHDDCFGTTEELKFIRFIHDRIDQLRRDHGEVRLIRNEKAVKIYAFEDGAAFEPDFLLFLEHDFDGGAAMVQLFIEPKGSHIAAGEEWKQRFLASIEAQAEVPNFHGKAYKLRGLPFFNENDWPAASAFREALTPYHAP